MTDLKLSVIVPVYNTAPYIERCLDSILGQTFYNIEVILVNDGSTDGSPEILECYAQKDERVKVIHQANRGVTAARLSGVQEACGDYVGFIDGDDFIESDMFDRLIQNAVKYGADISHCGYQMVFHNRIDFYYGTNKSVIQDHFAGLRDLLSGAFIEPGLVNKIFKRTLFEQILQDNSVDYTIKNHEDLLLNFFLFQKANKSVFEDFCPYHYIVRRDSAANRTLNENQLLDPLRVAKILVEETKEDAVLNLLAYNRLIRFEIALATKDKKLNPELIGRHRKTARAELRSMLPAIINKKGVSIKMKAMAVLATYCPQVYMMIHQVYAKMSGNDKKYDLGD